MSALLAADYRDRTMQVLEELRTGLMNKCDQMRIIADAHNKAHEFDAFENTYGQVIGLITAIDDIACLMQRERTR